MKRLPFIVVLGLLATLLLFEAASAQEPTPVPQETPTPADLFSWAQSTPPNWDLEQCTLSWDGWSTRSSLWFIGGVLPVRRARRRSMKRPASLRCGRSGSTIWFRQNRRMPSWLGRLGTSLTNAVTTCEGSDGDSTAWVHFCTYSWAPFLRFFSPGMAASTGDRGRLDEYLG